MSTRWYKKATVQASIVGGIFLVVAAFVTGVFQTRNRPSDQGPEVKAISPTVDPGFYPTHIPKQGSESLEEYIELLKYRGDKILNQLQGCPHRKYSARFRELHQKHLANLASKKFVIAHEILAEIQTLLAELVDRGCLPERSIVDYRKTLAPPIR